MLVSRMSPAPASAPAEPTLEWHPVAQWGVEGRAFAQAERKAWFDRLPAAAEGKVTTAVWNLSRDSAGMVVYFRTDATAIWTNYTVRKEKLAGFNMTAIGASGIDLYAKVFDRTNSESYIFPVTSIPTVLAHTKEVGVGKDKYAAGDVWAASFFWNK